MKPDPAAATLTSLRAEIDAWRATRQGRAHMPAHLWDAAVALVGPLPVTRVARELGLNRDRLSARVARRRASGPAREARPGAFVEVGAADLARISSRLPVDRVTPRTLIQSSDGVRVVLERTDGSKLSLELPSGEWPRVEALCSAFIRA